MINIICYCLISFIIGLILGALIFKGKKEDIASLIKKELSNSANEVIIEKQKFIQEQNQKELEAFLNPLKERIKEFQEKVEETNETNKINSEVLKEKITDLVKQNQMTISSTEKLSEAISHNSKARGILGEMILEKLLKSSGLIDKKENASYGNFELQKSFRLNDGSGDKRIADAVIYLAEGTKAVVVDSKAPLANFLNFLNAEEEEEKKKALEAFYKDTKDRIEELSDKYTDLEGLSTPDFVIMFIPLENTLNYIYSNNKLVEDALKKNVIIAGPSTLIAALRVINYSWAQKNQAENIKNITKLAENIYSKTITLIQRFENVKTAFDTLKGRFDDTFATIKGQGGLVSQVEKLKEYGLSPAKGIEAKYLEDEITK